MNNKAIHFAIKACDGLEVRTTYPNSMGIIVSPGIVMKFDVLGMCGYELSEDYTAEIEENKTHLRRVDRVVVRFDYKQQQARIVVLKGILGKFPSPPPLTQTCDIYEISLALVHVPLLVKSIWDSDIIDDRPNNPNA